MAQSTGRWNSTLGSLEESPSKILPDYQAHIVSQLLQQHYDKSEYKRGGAKRLMESGILRDYLNEKSNSQDLIEGFDSTLTWATPSNFKDRLLILDCASAATLLPDDEPEQLAWRSIKVTPTVDTVTLKRHPTLGFGFSLVTCNGGVFVRRVQQHSVIHGLGKLEEGDKVLSVAGTPVERGLTQKEIITMLKTLKEVTLVVCHSKFDGKGTPETNFDRDSPTKEPLSPALESSYRLALDLSPCKSKSSSKGSSYSKTSSGSPRSTGTKSYNSTSLSITGCNDGIRGDVRALKHSYKNKGSTGSIGDTASTSSSVDCTTSSDGSDPYRTPLSSPYTNNRKVIGSDSLNSSLTSSRDSSVRDFCLESYDSNSSMQSLGSTEYIVLPNSGHGIGIGISGKNGVIIRNILPNSVAEKDGRLQIGDHILAVNNLKCVNMSQKEAKEIVIPTLRNSTPTVKLVVQHMSQRPRNPSILSYPCSPVKNIKSTLPAKKSSELPGDLLLPEAMWSDEHPSGPVAYRFGTVVLPAPQWIQWSEKHHYVTLTRLASGYGFSIMDYKEPKERSEGSTSVLIIRQITPFGAADLEGHLGLGERIVSVNEELITTHSIEDIVSLIKPCSVLQLKMCEPVESPEWKKLLNTNISSVPLVSGPRNTHCNESGSTLHLSTDDRLSVRSDSVRSDSLCSADIRSYCPQDSVRSYEREEIREGVKPRFRYQTGSNKSLNSNTVNNTNGNSGTLKRQSSSKSSNTSVITDKSSYTSSSNSENRYNNENRAQNRSLTTEPYRTKSSISDRFTDKSSISDRSNDQSRFTSSAKSGYQSYRPQRMYEPALPTMASEHEPTVKEYKSYEPKADYKSYEPREYISYEPKPPTSPKPSPIESRVRPTSPRENRYRSYERPAIRKEPVNKQELDHSNTELESIISAVSLNNGELNDVWKKRIHQTTGPLKSQLSRV